MFSPEKASAAVRIPASTQHTNGLFEDYSNVCLCSPTPLAPPSAPTPSPNLHSCQNEENRRKDRVGKKKNQTYIFRKQWESNTTLSCTPIQNGLCRGWATTERNNSALATSIVNLNINNREGRHINAWWPLLYGDVQCKSPICLPMKCNTLLKTRSTLRASPSPQLELNMIIPINLTKCAENSSPPQPCYHHPTNPH